MTKVRAPKTGYSSDAKQDYRKQVWDSILDNAGGSGTVLILPSKDGEEIDYLISRGLPQSRIICIDENPALIATAPWRKKYKSIRAYGCKVSEAGNRLRKAKVKISAANLDLCNNFSEELVTEVCSFLHTAPVDSDFCFSVTVSKGREQSVVNYLMSMLMKSGKWQTSDYNKLSEKRISCLMRIASEAIPSERLVKWLREGSYIHHKTPMAWAVFRIIDCNNSAIVKNLIKKAEMERYLYSKSTFNWSDGEYISAADVDGFAKIVDTTTLPEIKREYKILYGFIQRVLTGQEEYAYMYAKLAEKERDGIMEGYKEITNNAMDWYSNANPIVNGLLRNGLSSNCAVQCCDKVYIYELIMSKFGGRKAN